MTPPPIIVLITSGPADRSNERFQAEVLYRENHTTFYRVRRLGTNELLSVHEHQIIWPKVETQPKPIQIEEAE
jgi:hypothetical protein